MYSKKHTKRSISRFIHHFIVSIFTSHPGNTAQKTPSMSKYILDQPKMVNDYVHLASWQSELVLRIYKLTTKLEISTNSCLSTAPLSESSLKYTKSVSIKHFTSGIVFKRELFSENRFSSLLRLLSQASVEAQ